MFLSRRNLRGRKTKYCLAQAITHTRLNDDQCDDCTGFGERDNASVKNRELFLGKADGAKISNSGERRSTLVKSATHRGFRLAPICKDELAALDDLSMSVTQDASQ
jgi:hypothetical protein